jgi:hypothetical protein
VSASDLQSTASGYSLSVALVAAEGSAVDSQLPLGADDPCFSRNRTQVHAPVIATVVPRIMLEPRRRAPSWWVESNVRENFEFRRLRG